MAKGLFGDFFLLSKGILICHWFKCFLPVVCIIPCSHAFCQMSCKVLILPHRRQCMIDSKGPLWIYDISDSVWNPPHISTNAHLARPPTGHGPKSRRGVSPANKLPRELRGDIRKSLALHRNQLLELTSLSRYEYIKEYGFQLNNISWAHVELDVFHYYKQLIYLVCACLYS